MRRNVRAEAKAYKVSLGWSTLDIVLIGLHEEVDAIVVAELSKNYNEPLIVGLPEGVTSPCSLALAYLYTLEDLEIGSRVKNKAILLLMNLLGLNQVRDVVEVVKNCKTLALIGTHRRLDDILADIADKLGIKEYDIKLNEINCATEDENLEKITLSRISRLR